jgi:H+/Cl- antiporter ClcA
VQRVRGSLGLVLVFALSLVLGLLVFEAIQWLIDEIWGVDGLFEGFPPLWALLGLPVLAAAVVAWARSRQSGHDPMAGLSVGPVEARAYPFLLLGIVVGLVGGAVLGPEIAMLFTGGVVAGLIAPRFGLDPNRAAAVGGLGGLLALFVGPAVSGSTTPDSYSFAAVDIPTAVLAAVGAVAAVALARLVGRMVARARPGDAVSLPVLLGGGLALGVLAATYQAVFDESSRLVLTSGEHMIDVVTGLGSVGLITWTVAAKMLAYGISMGAGFRGGPYFPAMFAGAGSGAVAAGLTGGDVQAAATAGLLAAVTYLAHAKWVVTIVISVVVGFAVGGPAVLPLAVAGGLIGRAVPRVDPRPTGSPAPAASRSTPGHRNA